VTFPADKIDLRIIPISGLRPHEETVERLSMELRRAIVEEGVQRDPVVVDDSSGTILDGTHRVEALGKAGARSVLAYVVDYNDPYVRLYRWYRVVRNPARELVAEIVGELGLMRLGRLEAGNPARAADNGVVLTYRGEAFGKETPGLLERTGAMRAFDRAAARRELLVDFVDEDSAAPGLLHGPDLFLIPPKFGKQDVLVAAKEGRLFPPKSTLHVFPFRPLGVRYPVEDLKAGRDVLAELLRSKRARLVEPSSSHGGRKYREKIVVFE